MTNTVLKKTADVAKKLRDTSKEKEIKRKKRSKYSECSVQEYIPVKAIRNGFVITTDKRLLMILEIDGINFSQMTNEAQDNAMRKLAQLFRRGFKKQIIRI